MRRDHRQALEVYARHLRRRNLAPSTCELLLRTARRFLCEALPLKRIRRQDLRTYLAGRALVLAPPTQVGEVSRLRSFFQALVEEGVLTQDPTEGFEVPTARSVARRVLPEEAVKRILTAASDEGRPGGRPVALRDRALLEILYGLGLRASEARAARVVDLSLAEGVLLVRPAKRGTPRALPLPRAAVPHLAAYLRESRPILTARRLGQDEAHLLVGQTGAPLRGNQVQKIVKAVTRRAGLEDVSPHDFRRALATHLSRRGVSVLAIQHLLGHGSVASTQVYLALEAQDLRRAVEALDGWARAVSNSDRGLHGSGTEGVAGGGGSGVGV